MDNNKREPVLDDRPAWLKAQDELLEDVVFDFSGIDEYFTRIENPKTQGDFEEAARYRRAVQTMEQLVREQEARQELERVTGRRQPSTFETVVRSSPELKAFLFPAWPPDVEY